PSARYARDSVAHVSRNVSSLVTTRRTPLASVRSQSSTLRGCTGGRGGLTVTVGVGVTVGVRLDVGVGVGVRPVGSGVAVGDGVVVAHVKPEQSALQQAPSAPA